MDDPVMPGASLTASKNVTDDPVPVPARVEDEPPPMEGSPAGPAADRGGHPDIAAEHARLVAEIAQARARYQDLQANRPDPGDIEACKAHKALEDAASQAAFDAAMAADFYLRENPQLVPVYGAARAMLAEGICVIPVGPGKRPALKSWREFQKRLPTLDELHEWFAVERDDRGLAVVCGEVSGNLEMLELEGTALAEGILEEFEGYLAEAGLLETWQRMCQGNSTRSPSGGLHVLFRCDEVAGNTKLAARPATDEELAAEPEYKIRVLIETRGEGGYVVAAPSPGGCHPSGKPWTGLFGGPRTTVTISAAERDGIFACARKCSKVPAGTLHEHPERTRHETLSGPGRRPAGGWLRTGLRPGDIYNERGPDWPEIVEPHGYRHCREEANGTVHWTRPGKAGGTSATTGNPQHGGDKFHCFSSSTPFEPDCSYSKFAVYAILNSDGDWSAAAAQLVRDGYVPDMPVKPSVEKAIYAFEEMCDLRQSAGGEFWARPAASGMPAVVTEIGDDLGRVVALWWRRMGEAWNEEVMRRKQQAAEEEAEMEAAAQAHLESLSEQERAAAEQAEREKAEKEQEEAVSKPSKPPEEEDTKAQVFSNAEQISKVLFHLKTSATQHERIDLHMRVMDEPGMLVVDLCDDQGRVVMITAGGWQVSDLREVPGEPWFRRGKYMTPQVVPARPEDVVAVLQEAKEIVGLADEQWALALSWLVGGHFPSIDRSGLWETGPSGAGKTTRAKMLAGWIDPARELGGRINLRRDERDARAKAMGRFVFSMDNVATVSRDDSDFWCTLHTGVADEVRQLHTDNTMLSYDYKRIGLGTSLSMPSGFEPDALRRMIHIELEASDKHPPTDKLWQAYEEIKPRVLGALYTVLTGVLNHLDEALAADLADCPEMSAYARRLYAADLAYPQLGLYAAYRDHTAGILIEAAGNKKLAMLVVEALAKQAESEEGIKLAKAGQLAGAVAELAKSKKVIELKPDEPLLTDTPTGLYDFLHNLAGIRVMEGEKWFPADPTRLGHELTSLFGPLRAMGIIVRREKSGSRRYRIFCKPGVARTLADAAVDAGRETSVH
jgi:hypothetical protein